MRNEEEDFVSEYCMLRMMRLCSGVRAWVRAILFLSRRHGVEEKNTITENKKSKKIKRGKAETERGKI